MNEHLAKVQSGDQGTAVTVDMEGQKFGGDTSGFCDEGNYRLKISKAEWYRKNKLTLKTSMKIVGPPGCDALGTKIVHYQTVPDNEKTGDDLAKAQRNFANFFASIMSAEGRLEDARAAGRIDVTPSKLEGKELCAFIVDDDSSDRQSSRVAYFMDAEEYAKDAGPTCVTVWSEPAPQGEAPEMMGGGDQNAAPDNGAAGVNGDVDNFLGTGGGQTQSQPTGGGGFAV